MEKTILLKNLIKNDRVGVVNIYVSHKKLRP